MTGDERDTGPDEILIARSCGHRTAMPATTTDVTIYRLEMSPCRACWDRLGLRGSERSAPWFIAPPLSSRLDDDDA
jgi:hypothetical protein